MPRKAPEESAKQIRKTIAILEGQLRIDTPPDMREAVLLSIHRLVGLCIGHGQNLESAKVTDN